VKLDIGIGNAIINRSTRGAKLYSANLSRLHLVVKPCIVMAAPAEKDAKVERYNAIAAKILAHMASVGNQLCNQVAVVVVARVVGLPRVA